MPITSRERGEVWEEVTFELPRFRVCIELERASQATASVTKSTKEKKEDRKVGKKQRSQVMNAWRRTTKRKNWHARNTAQHRGGAAREEAAEPNEDEE